MWVFVSMFSNDLRAKNVVFNLRIFICLEVLEIVYFFLIFWFLNIVFYFFFDVLDCMIIVGILCDMRRFVCGMCVIYYCNFLIDVSERCKEVL